MLYVNVKINKCTYNNLKKGVIRMIIELAKEKGKWGLPLNKHSCHYCYGSNC